MKKIIFYCFFAVLLACPGVFAEEDPLQDVHRSLKDQVFIVDSSESDDSDALNRISGNIDLGFSLPDQSYDSTNHYKAGPFGREESIDKAQNY